MKKRKVGFVVRVTAAVVAAAVLLYRLLRRVDNDTASVITDKIADMFLTGSVADRIYNAALQRLQRRFTEPQSKILARLMVAQSKYESANYTSNVFRVNHNSFGYKYYPGSLYQKSVGSMSPEGNSYALYADVADSAREVADWIGRRVSDFLPVVNAYSLVNGREYVPFVEYAQALKRNGYYGEAALAYAGGIKQFYTV